MESVFNEIKSERIRQNNKWGEQNHSPIEWLPILMEEVGEASKEAVDYHFKNPIKSEDGRYLTITQSHQERRINNYRKELIQVAAVVVQMIECLDRNNKTESKS